MKHFNALLGTLAGSALSFVCIESNAAITGNGYNDQNSQGTAIIVMADNSSTMRDDAAKPAMGGEGDGAIGGNAPNPEPDRSMSTVAEDAGITAKVKAKLLADTMVSGLKIDVDTLSGVVYLTGDNMDTQAAIDQAMKLAKETDGVKKVVSKLSIGDVKA
jgi:hyperosmotically inducible protein